MNRPGGRPDDLTMPGRPPVGPGSANSRPCWSSTLYSGPTLSGSWRRATRTPSSPTSPSFALFGGAVAGQLNPDTPTDPRHACTAGMPHVLILPGLGAWGSIFVLFLSGLGVAERLNGVTDGSWVQSTSHRVPPRATAFVSTQCPIRRPLRGITRQIQALNVRIRALFGRSIHRHFVPSLMGRNDGSRGQARQPLDQN